MSATSCPVTPTKVSAPAFLFFGYGAEYSLHDLYEFMSAQGDHCIEIDMLVHPDTEAALRALVGKRVVLVTSAHLLYDLTNFFFYRTDRVVISPLHVISSLEPVASVYYPHDLKDPIKAEEVPYLPLFDLLLSPTAALARYDDLVRVEQVGWIKRQRRAVATVQGDWNPSRRVFFPGSYQYWLNHGIDRFIEYYAPLLAADAAVKLPRWHENEAFEESLRAQGFRVYPNDANSIDVMEANDVIYTEALSSVGIEACALGKRVCYIKNNVFDYRDPVVEFADVGRIGFAESPCMAARMTVDTLPPNTAQMGYFEFEAARAAIHGLLADEVCR